VNLLLRLMALMFATLWRSRLHPEATSQLRFCVWPTDLDISLHMNNGRYLTIMDLGRMDYVLRTGLWRIARRDGLTPMVSAITIRYRRELEPFQRYDLTTAVVGWSDTSVIFEQAFIIRSGPRIGQTAARALVRAGLYDRKARAFARTAALAHELGASVAIDQPLGDDLKAFAAGEAALRTRESRSAGA